MRPDEAPKKKGPEKCDESWKHSETAKRCYDELWDAGFKLKGLCVLEDAIYDTQKVSSVSAFRINDKSW